MPSQNAEPQSKFEVSELLMYKNTVMMEMGDLQQTWNNLLAIDAKVVDRMAFLERKGTGVGGRCGENKKHVLPILVAGGP